MSKIFEFHAEQCRVSLHGMIDRYTIGQLLAGLDLSKSCKAQLTIDFSEVEKVDSAGLAWLLKIVGQANRAGQTVHFTHLPEQLLKLARVCGVESLITH